MLQMMPVSFSLKGRTWRLLVLALPPVWTALVPSPGVALGTFFQKWFDD